MKIDPNDPAYPGTVRNPMHVELNGPIRPTFQASGMPVRLAIAAQILAAEVGNCGIRACSDSDPVLALRMADALITEHNEGAK